VNKVRYLHFIDTNLKVDITDSTGLFVFLLLL